MVNFQRPNPVFACGHNPTHLAFLDHQADMVGWNVDANHVIIIYGWFNSVKKAPRAGQ
jgi:hypothetical protein